jgi:hypothetical protein
MRASPSHFESSLRLSFLPEPLIDFIQEKPPLTSKMMAGKVAFLGMTINCDPRTSKIFGKVGNL